MNTVAPIVLRDTRVFTRKILSCSYLSSNRIDISGLKPALKRRLKGEQPVQTTPSIDASRHRPWHSNKYKNRMLFGRFGSASGVDPHTLWPTEAEIEIETDKLRLQKPLDERIERLREEKRLGKEEFERHQQHVASRMERMDEFMEQYRKRRQKHSALDEQKLKQRESMLEEAREFFGYDVSHRDLKFQQLIEWKQEEAKRRKKISRRVLKDEYLVAKIQKLAAEAKSD